MIENIDAIKSQLEIEQVLQYIGYYKSNPKPMRDGEVGDFCPVHEGDSQRSLSFNIATKLGKCHSCGFEGDLIELYRKTKNLDFYAAVKDLAGHFGIEIFSGATKTTIANAVSASKQIESATVLQKTKLTQQQVQQELDKASISGGHEYLKEKCVVGCPGLRFGKDQMGNYSIVVPFYNSDKELQTIQYVHASGKYFLKDGLTSGSFFTIGDFQEDDEVYLAEGIATALTIWMALYKKSPVISFGSAGNMVSVVNALKSKYQNLKLVICLDKSDAAYKQVVKINPAYNCSYRLPSFEGLTTQDTSKTLSDFNDLVSKCDQSISVVREQLMIEKTINDLPIVKKEVVAELAIKANDMPTSFNDEYQEELLSYLMNKPFENIIVDGFSPEALQPNMFTGYRRDIMSGIVKCWESDLPVTATQISIYSGNNSPGFYTQLNRINGLPILGMKQIAERIAHIKRYKAQDEFKKLIAGALQSDAPLHEKAAILRKGIDDIQGSSETILPQSHYLHQIINDLKNPKHKPLASGIASLDRLIGGGFIKGELGMLSGGAGAGKTALALQVADSVAAIGGIVIYVSVEIGTGKLTHRSFKRLSYQSDIEISFKDNHIPDYAISRYEELKDNIYLKKGHHGMPVTEIRGMVLCVMRQHRDKDILLIIDPFQRLGTGNEKIDGTNETIKVNNLVSQLKEMAEDLSIPILALSDTVKDHKNNKTGEGSIRGSYMADHTADYTMMLRASRSAIKAVYDLEGRELEAAKQEDPFIVKVEEALKSPHYSTGRFRLKSDYDKYVSLVTSKVRDNGKFSPLFVFRPKYHLFEDTPLWDKILPKDD